MSHFETIDKLGEFMEIVSCNGKLYRINRDMFGEVQVSDINFWNEVEQVLVNGSPEYQNVAFKTFSSLTPVTGYYIPNNTSSFQPF